MATNVGEAVIKLTFDGKDVKASLSKVESEAEKEAQNSGNRISGIFKGAAKAASAAIVAAGAAVVAITKKSVTEFAKFEQLVGGVETLFKDSANVVRQYADNAYMSAGLSANDYMETVTSFSASLLQGLGGDTAKAAKIANKAIVDMSDNANKMGTSMEMIQNAYQGFAKQNYTMLDNLKLGYGGTASEMARLINDSGVLGNTMKVTAKTVNDVSFDKMIEAIHVVQDNLGITGTTAKEAATTIQGSLTSMKAAWTNALTGMADDTQDFDVLMSNLVSSAETFAKNLLPRIKIALRGVSDLIEWLGTEIVIELPGLVSEILPSVLESVNSIFGAIMGQLPFLLQTLLQVFVDYLPQFVDMITNAIPQFVDGLVQLLNKLVEAIPTIMPQMVTAITNLIQTLAMQLTRPDFLTAILQAAITLLMEIVKAWPQIMTALIEALPQIIENLVAFLLDPANLQMIIEGAVQLFMGIVMAVPQILGALLGAFGSLVGSLWDWITSRFGQFASDFGNFIGNIFKGAINGMIAFIENFINAPIDLINGFLGVINDAFGWLGVHIDPIARINLPRLAQGGVVDSATAAIIGEQGQEAVLPLEHNTDNWAGLLAQTLAIEMDNQNIGSDRPINVYMTNKIDNVLDADEIGQVMMESIRRAA